MKRVKLLDKYRTNETIYISTSSNGIDIITVRNYRNNRSRDSRAYYTPSHEQTKITNFICKNTRQVSFALINNVTNAPTRAIADPGRVKMLENC